MLCKYIMLFVFLFSTSSFAKDIQVSLVAAFATQKVDRGALTWNKPLFLFAPGFKFWDKLIIGPGLRYQHKFNDHHQLELRLEYKDGGGPRGPIARFGSNVPEYMFKRGSTFESALIYSFKPKKKTHFEIEYYKELHQHHGNYIYAQVSQPILPLTRIGFGRGFGDKKHNNYLYGAGAKASLTHYDLYLNVFFPFWLKKGIIVNAKYAFSMIDTGELENLYHIQGKKKNTNFTIFALYRFK